MFPEPTTVLRPLCLCTGCSSCLECLCLDSSYHPPTPTSSNLLFSFNKHLLIPQNWINTPLLWGLSQLTHAWLLGSCAPIIGIPTYSRTLIKLYHRFLCTRVPPSSDGGFLEAGTDTYSINIKCLLCASKYISWSIGPQIVSVSKGYPIMPGLKWE